MTYHTYTTKAVVCGTFNRNTADASYLLFTREAGMLYADARSSRQERSKQRYALQDFSLVRVSLIKGRRNWRVGSIEALDNYYHQADGKEARGSVVSLCVVLRRFMKGEVVDIHLFDYVTQAERKFVLNVIQVSILAGLGYVDVKQIPYAVREVTPRCVSDSYSMTVDKQIEKLYIHAVSVSHL